MNTSSPLLNLDAEQRAVQAVHSTWMEAVNAGDVERLRSLMTDDAVLISPGQAPIGPEGLCSNLAAALKSFRFTCTSVLEEIVVVGPIAYTRCRDGVTTSPLTGGAPTPFSGYRFTIYRQQPDGRWLLARDAHTVAETKG